MFSVQLCCNQTISSVVLKRCAWWYSSALYVVDLAKFRQTASGDTLRVFYEQLSKDSNSLSNLDQVNDLLMRLFDLRQNRWMGPSLLGANLVFIVDKNVRQDMAFE